MQIAFYHLERAPVTEVLPKLLEKALAAGLRTLVHVRDDKMMEEIDQSLWTYDPGSFLPHGTQSQGHVAEQPILVSFDGRNENASTCAAVLDGQVPADMNAFERCLYIFDGQDTSAVEKARAHWKEFKAHGHDVTYWQQGPTGGWQKMA